jgi:hypothetical protein
MLLKSMLNWRVILIMAASILMIGNLYAKEQKTDRDQMEEHELRFIVFWEGIPS